MPGIIRCPSCGREISADSRFCEHCTARICPGCHRFVPPKAVYCPHCGFAVGPAVPGATEQQPPTPPPPPRTSPSSQGGITGRPITQPHPPPPIRSTPASDAAPTYPIPQTAPPQRYAAGDQYAGTGGYGTPGSPIPSAYSGPPQPLSAGPRMPSGPIPARRFPGALVVLILIILGVGLFGFAAFSAGWLESPLNAVQGFVGGLEWPKWLPIGRADTTPPIIQNVSVSGITKTGAVVTWKTDEPATSQVMVCDPGGSCTWTELDETLVTTHSVSLSNLKPNIAYKLTATSTDAKENQAVYEGEFTTLSGTATATSVISGITASNIADLSATISWKTDKPTSSLVEYGIEDTYGTTTPPDAKLTTNHSVTLTGLNPNTTYHFRVKSKDDSGSEAISQDKTFTTRGTVAVTAETGPEVGKRAPDFTLPDINGKAVNLSDFRGKIVMVKFWVDGQSARNEMPIIQEFYKKWTGKELVLLAVNWKQTPEEVQKFVTDRGLTFPVLVDEKGEVATKYRVSPSTYPTTFFINSDGIIKERRDAPLRNEIQIESIINSL